MSVNRGSLLHSPNLDLWHELEGLAKRYGYDPNHNLRYLALARTIQDTGAKNLVVLGAGKGITESMLPPCVTSVSLDINRADLIVASRVNEGMPNHHFVQGDIFQLPFAPDFRTRMVIVSEVLEHVAEDDRLLVIANRLLDDEGYLLLTVPNFERFINRFVAVLGRKPYHMSEDHLREYTLTGAAKLLGEAGFTPLFWTPVYLRVAKEVWLRRRWLRLTNPIRNLILLLFPRFATYCLILARRKAQSEH